MRLLQVEQAFIPFPGATSTLSRFLFCAAAALPSRMMAPAPGVVMINEAMAKQYWPNGDPLKDRIQIGAGAGPAFAEPPRQVIGIVGDTHDGGLNRDPFPIMYIPIAQMPDAETALNSRVAPLWWIVRSYDRPPYARHIQSRPRYAKPAAACPSRIFAPWMKSKCATLRASASICCC